MRISPSDFSTPPPTWPEIFGNTNPVEVEIGPGKGAFLLALARNHPERNFFAVELSKRRAFRLNRLIERDGPTNVISIHADMACLVRTLIWPNSVAAYHIYFPDPWWKKRHHRRRLFRDDFADAITRTLMPRGTIFLASDVAEYFAEIVQQFAAVPQLTQFPWTRDQVSKKGKPILTDFERKYTEQGRPVWYAGFRKTEMPLAPTDSAPAPRFAGR